MQKLVVLSFAVAVLASSAPAPGAAAAPDDQTAPAGQLRDMGQMRGVMLDARLAGMKAALKLTPEQEKNWAPFEAAVRDAAKARADEMHAMREADHGQRPSPLEHLNSIADRLAKASSDLKAIASAAKPLYDSLDDSQKSHFRWLLATLRPSRQHEGRMMDHRDNPGPDAPK